MPRPIERVLVVDDDPFLLLVLGEVIADMGYEVVTMLDPNLALDALSREDFVVVVSDLLMPGIDGVALVEAARARGFQVPVVLITSSPSIRARTDALAAGAYAFLARTVDEETLRDTLAAAARECRLSRTVAAVARAAG